MQLTVRLDGNGPASLQQQLFEQLRRMMLDGRLPAGHVLPSSRELSAQLAVSRTTVVLAYDRLQAEGYVESKRSVGMFVSATMPEDALLADRRAIASGGANRCGGSWSSVVTATLALPGTSPSLPAPPVPQVVNPDRHRLEIDFWVGRPAAEVFPLRAWRRIVDEQLRIAGSALTEYQDPQGLPALRTAVIEHVGPARGIVATPAEVVIVGGSQDGLGLVARMLAGPGSTFVHEDPGYQGAVFMFATHGARCVPVPVDEAGIVVDRLPSAVRGAVLYVTPSHQYPLGATLCLERRHHLLDWAGRTESFVVEDDYDGDFRYEGAPLEALRSLDRDGRVLYLGTFSKSLGAGLRLGYLIVPPGLAPAARAWKTLASIGTPWMEQAAMASFMASGGFERHLRRIRTIYRQRRDHLVAALERHFPAPDIRGRQGGMHLSWRLAPPLPDAPTLAQLARSVGVGIHGLEAGGAVVDPHNPRAGDTVVLGYAALSEPVIDDAIARLAAVCARTTRAAVAT